MTVTAKHKFVSQVPDSKDESQVRSSNWNDDHTITIGTGKVLLGNASANAAPVAEITMGDGFRISDEGALEYDGTIPRVDGLQAALDSKFSKQTTAQADTLTGAETMPVLQAGVEKQLSVNQLVADKALTASKFDANGAWAGLVGPGGAVSQEFIVVASGAPNDADGRPNGTLYFRMA